MQNYNIQGYIKSKIDGKIKEINIYEKNKIKPDLLYYIIDSLFKKNDNHLLESFVKDQNSSLFQEFKELNISN